MSELAHYQPQAAELTAGEWEQRKQAAHEIQQEIAGALLAGKASAWALAGALYKAQQETVWATLQYESQNEWLADPDIGLTRTTFRRYVSCWHEFVVRRELDMDELLDIDLSKADVVIAAIQDGSKAVDEALADVRALGWRDLREKYREQKTLPAGSSAGPARTPKPMDGMEGQEDEPQTADRVGNLAKSGDVSFGQVEDSDRELLDRVESKAAEKEDAEAAQDPEEVPWDEIMEGDVMPAEEATYESVLAELLAAYEATSPRPLSRATVAYVLDFLEGAPPR